MTNPETDNVGSQQAERDVQSSRPARGSRILFAQIPLELLKDPKISESAKTIYAILHSYAAVDNKDLRHNPVAYAPQARLAKDIGRSIVTVWKRLVELEKTGWIQIRRRGFRKPNKYTLIGKQPTERRRIARDRAYREWQQRRSNRHNDAKES